MASPSTCPSSPGFIRRKSAGHRLEATSIEEDEFETLGSHHALTTSERLVLVPRPNPEKAIEIRGLAASLKNGSECGLGREGVRKINPGDEHARSKRLGEHAESERGSSRTEGRRWLAPFSGSMVGLLIGIIDRGARSADLAQSPARKAAPETCVEVRDPCRVKAPTGEGSRIGESVGSMAGRTGRASSRKMGRLRNGIGRGGSNLGTEIDEQGLEGFGAGRARRVRTERS